MTSFLVAVLAAFLVLQWDVESTVRAFQPTRIPSSRHRRLRPATRWPRLGGGGGRSAAGVDVLGAGGGDDDEGNGEAAGPKAEAERLLAKARAIRESLGADGETVASDGAPAATAARSDFSLPPPSSPPRGYSENRYRLYVDVGREKGTWMEPRWGASGRRIECTVDIDFVRPSASGDDAMLASGEISSGLIKTVTSKSSSLSPAYELHLAPYARLRRGFDKMALIDGGYCIESPPSSKASMSSSSTLRFCLSVAGTTDGDVTIPEGKLYFALPYFGLRTTGDGDAAPKMALSNREGIVTVKQMGWNTAWWREESRILGVFRAVPLEKARERDRF